MQHMCLVVAAGSRFAIDTMIKQKLKDMYVKLHIFKLKIYTCNNEHEVSFYEEVANLTQSYDFHFMTLTSTTKVL